MKPQPKIKRVIDKKYIAWIRTLQCISCRINGPSDAHHVNKKGYGSMSSKTDDTRSIPLCRECHVEIHTQGRETFRENHDLDYEAIINAYQTIWRVLNDKKA